MRQLHRAPKLNRQFDAFSWSAGYNHHQDHLSLKVNIGKSFRMPIAKELGANGVNYHRFSYEVGDTALSPEISYQLDAGLEWNASRFAVGISPFANYFSNYIYLNPTPFHDRLYGNGNQIFRYRQSEVLRLGGEFHAHYNILNPLTLGFIGEYVYAEQLSGAKKGFTLPFSPPAVALFNLKYSKPAIWIVRHVYASVDFKIAASQNRIVPPEEKTPGYQLVHFSLGGEVPAWGQSISFRFQVHNLFNAKYFNHTSYYRLINLPGQGRNFILNVTIPFSTDLKSVN
jgi:iron complex outermembrane receptor protein